MGLIAGREPPSGPQPPSAGVAPCAAVAGVPCDVRRCPWARWASHAHRAEAPPHWPEDRRHAVLARRCDTSRRIRHQCYGRARRSPRHVRAAQRGRARHATRRRRTKERLEGHAEAGPGGRIEVLEPHKVHCRATNWRCQRSSVVGDTIRTCKSSRGSTRGLLMETAGNTVSEIDPRVRGSRPDVWCGAWRRTH
jgi:hypothetical protein